MHTKDGQPVTPEMLDEWAAEFESGRWPEGTTKKGLGRPEEHDECMQSVTVRLPESQLMQEHGGHMKTVTLRELEDDFDAIMARVAEGTTILVECEDPSANAVILSAQKYREIESVIYGDEPKHE